MNYLDFDNVITQPVSFYQGNYYDKTFHVTKDGVDYDWADIEDIIVQARITKQSSEPTLELKKSAGDIDITTGYMTWHLTTSKTSIPSNNYGCFEVILVYTGGKIRVWWDAHLMVKRRAYNG